MMPKPSKIIKKGYDPPGNNYIALGSRSKDNSSSTATTSTTATTTTTVLYPNSNELPISNSTIKQTTTNSNSSTNLLNQPTESIINLNNNSNSTSTNNNSKPIKLTTNNSSSNLQSLASNITTTNNNNISNNNNSSNNPFYLDSKNVRDEITKLLEKDDTNEKLIKIIKSLIINLRSPSNGSSSVLSSSSNTINKQQTQSQSSPQQQPDLNFLMALSVVIYKRPQLFVKQTSLVEFLCTNLLFTSKNPIQDKLSNSSTSSSNMLKSKSLQSLRPPSSPQQSLISIQPVICNMLGFIYENETTWPEIFVKAYVDDSLGERSWVDSPLCKDFVDNIKTAFCTRPIPFSVENSSLNSNLINNSNSNSSSDLQSLKNNEDSILELSGGVIDFTNKKTTQIPRYDSIRNEIEVLLVDLIRNYMSMNSKSQPVKRLLGQTVGTLGSASNSVNTIDNRNFLKLLQNTCGFGEIRAIALSKLESWLLNPKLDPSAQDLLLAICVNCNQADQMDKDIISQIIKIKPKLKQSQHYWDCIRELIKLNTNNFETLIQLTVRNELVLQLQQLNLQQQQQPQQQQQITSSKNTHNLNLLQISFSTDGLTSSKILAQTMLKIILQRNGEDHMRSLRILLRDTVRNSRQDFDLIKFTNELISDNLIKKYFFSINGDSSQSNSTCLLFSIAGGLADFSMNQTRERYVNSICDLITVCILVAITPQIKEAYLRRTYETRDILIKYYMAMSQIQSDSVTWLQSIFKPYDLNPTELVRCLFKILFMVDKPEQCYTIDNWPSEQERGTMFRVVSEIPVLSETLHQVLMMTQQLPDHMYMLMLCVEENLLKTASLVHIKDVYSLKLNKIEQFVDNLFNICLYKYQNPPTPLVVTVLYWRAWQILLLICALDPKNFGRIAWDNYPTLRLLMEMVMIDDYNFPPQCSITEDISIERFRSFETQADQIEKLEILDFENIFERKQGLGVKNESNSKLIGQVMRFDPTGPPRRPKLDTIQNIRKLNSEYKLGQLLCKNRQPDFLLMLIKRQNSKLSLPWLSSLIETNSDCLEVLPIQCICEFVWNLLSGTEEEITLKKQLNIEQLINRIKTILTTDDLSDSTTIQQITDTFDYFLNKLCSDKQTIRYGSLKILNKLFLSSNCILDRLQIPPLPGQTQPQHQQQIQIDLEQLINSFKQLNSYNICLKPLLVKYFRKALMVETNPNYLNLYLEFLFKQLLIDYKQQSELESSLKMQLDESENVSILIKNESFKTTYNEIGYDLADFFFKRDYYLNSIRLFNFENELIDENNLITLTSFLYEFSSLILKLNEINSNDDSENEDNFLIKNKQEFRRDRLDSNSFLLIENLKTNKFYYINEKLFNLIIYFVILIVKLSNLLDKNDKFNLNEFYDALANIKLLNCTFNEALNQISIDHLLKLKFQSKQENESQLREYLKYKSTDTSTKPDEIFSLSFRLIDLYIDSISNDLNHLFKIISNKYGLSLLVSYLIIEKIEILFNKPNSQITNDLSIEIGMSIKSLNDIVQSYISKFKIFFEKNSDLSKYLIGVKLGENLEDLKNKKSAQNGDLDIEMSDAGKMKFFSIKKREKFGKKEMKTEAKTNKILNNIQSEIDRIRKEKELKLKQDDVRDDISIVSDDEEENNTQLMRIINESNNQNLEFNLNKKLNDLSIDERIISISETILRYEDKKNEHSLLRRSRSSSSKIIKELNDSFNQSQNQKISLKRCIIDILLDYLCHFDPQIVNKQFEVEFLLLFELRNVKYDSQNESKSGSELTQSFLLSLFLHQANWHKLYDCIQFILKDHDFFCKHDQKYSLNPTNILDFLTSLIHIPELWKGTESRIVKKSEEENVLNLTVKQICIIIDFIIEEMFILFLIKNKKQTTSSNLDDLTDLDSLKQTLDKRIELLKHLFKNFKQKSQKENLFDHLLSHLNKQKYILNKFNLSNLKNLTNDVQSKAVNDFNFLKLILKKLEDFSLCHLENVLHKIQTLFLYRIYLEESSIIYKITNSNRLFTDFYFQIDKPTQLDLKAHNLLNCFGEIEVNLSHNLTSSGIIGVAVSATSSKKENQELFLFSKKQEAFMVDANFVCVKLASSHPFIFIRQLPMMEGLLQGRVGYSFEEFKKRKFEKLFHYVIDILNSLVPYVFHQKYIEYIESIISHYFDVFMSYCAENREFIGGLVSKFVEFLEKFINCDIKIGYCLIIRKYSQSISFLQKTYPDISSLKYLNSIQSIPFESIENLKNLTRTDLLKLMPKCLNNVNNLNQKLSMQLLSSKQLEPFINKLTNRNSFESVLSVLQELDVVSQRQPIILSHFVVYLQPLMIDSSDLVRDLAISLIMRHLRLNPKETFSFEQAFLECLNDSSSKVFNSIVKYLPELALLCSDKSQLIIKKAFQGASRHNIDISKQMTDSIRLLQLEKYVY